MHASKPSTNNYVIAVLLLLIGVNALGGGYYGMSGAGALPTEWLQGSIFRSYFIPGLFLFVVIGGSCIVSAIMILRQHHLARTAAISSGFLLLMWLGIQVAIIGYVSWMQPATAIVAILILLLAILRPLSRNPHHH